MLAFDNPHYSYESTTILDLDNHIDIPPNNNIIPSKHWAQPRNKNGYNANANDNNYNNDNDNTTLDKKKLHIELLREKLEYANMYGEYQRQKNLKLEAKILELSSVNSKF